MLALLEGSSCLRLDSQLAVDGAVSVLTVSLPSSAESDDGEPPLEWLVNGELRTVEILLRLRRGLRGGGHRVCTALSPRASRRALLSSGALELCERGNPWQGRRGGSEREALPTVRWQSSTVKGFRFSSSAIEARCEMKCPR